MSAECRARRRRKRGRALEPRRRSARLHVQAAARGGPAASTRGTPAGGSAVDARRREGKKSCGKRAVDGSARVRKKSHARTAGGVWRSSAVSARGIAATCKNWCRKHRTGTASAMAPSRCSVVRASRCCGGRETNDWSCTCRCLTVLSGHADGDVLSQCGGDMAVEDGESGEVGNAGGCGVHRARAHVRSARGGGELRPWQDLSQARWTCREIGTRDATRREAHI